MNKRTSSAGIGPSSLLSGRGDELEDWGILQENCQVLDALEPAQASTRAPASTFGSGLLSAGGDHHGRPQGLLELSVPGPLRCHPIVARSGQLLEQHPKNPASFLGVKRNDRISLTNDSCGQPRSRNNKRKWIDDDDDIALDLSIAKIKPSASIALTNAREVVPSAARVIRDAQPAATNGAAAVLGTTASPSPEEEDEPIIQQEKFQYLFDFLRKTSR